MSLEISPGVIAPNRDFLVGAIYGFNAARKRLEGSGDLQPLFSDCENKEMKEVTNKDFYLGYWLEITCSKCKMLYTFEGPNDLPADTLKCLNKECDNVIILYNAYDVKMWRIGEISFI